MEMLHRYAFSNFQSFKDRTEVSWLLDVKVPAGVWSEKVPTGERVSSVMAIVGPNASGKTGLLKPVAFLHWFLTQSFQLTPDAPLPFHPHPSSKETPTEFEIEVDFEGQLWRYTLRATPQRVLHEALYVKRQHMGYVFVRDWDAERQTYAVKQQDFGFNQTEALKVRANASFIPARPWAAELGGRRFDAPDGPCYSEHAWMNLRLAFAVMQDSHDPRGFITSGPVSRRAMHPDLHSI